MSVKMASAHPPVDVSMEKGYQIVGTLNYMLLIVA